MKTGLISIIKDSAGGGLSGISYNSFANPQMVSIAALAGGVGDQFLAGYYNDNQEGLGRQLIDYYTLSPKTLNENGKQYRFGGRSGGYADKDNWYTSAGVISTKLIECPDNIIRDHYTGNECLGSPDLTGDIDVSQNVAIDVILLGTWGGSNDWVSPTLHQFTALRKPSEFLSEIFLDDHIFDWGSHGNIWTGETASETTAKGIYINITKGGWVATNWHSSPYLYFPIRKFYND